MRFWFLTAELRGQQRPRLDNFAAVLLLPSQVFERKNVVEASLKKAGGADKKVTKASNQRIHRSTVRGERLCVIHLMQVWK